MVTVVIGGQYGSEAKGKAAVIKMNESDSSAKIVAVRCGGPNAGHTVYVDGTPVVLRQIPSCCVNPNAKLVISSGSVVNVELLKDEISKLEQMGVDIMNRLYIDFNATQITKEDINFEKSLGIGMSLGSTVTGTGSGTAGKVLRRAKSMREIDDVLSACLTDTVGMLLDANDELDTHIIVEGTQGSGLSLNASGNYPYTTSRDTNASSFISECGLPMESAMVVMVVRTWPIRVGGNSGPMWSEVNWETVHDYAGFPEEVKLIEMTSVTKKVRRVARFDFPQYRRALRINRPIQVMIHGLDYINYEDLNKKSFAELSKASIDFVMNLNSFSKNVLDVDYDVVTHAFTGPAQESYVTYQPSKETLEESIFGIR